MTRRLRIRFDRVEDFRREFDRNIAKGGVFVPEVGSLELREVVEVEIELEFAPARRTLEAEVVHVAPGAGVAVQFLRSAAEVRAEFAPWIAPTRAARSEPEVVSADERTDVWDLGDLEASADLDGIDLGDPDRRDLDLAAGASGIDLGAAEELGVEQERMPLPPARPERRGAARARARVPAKLDAENTSIEGVTRDLSETGALISADASAMPLGKAVRLRLRNPETGDPLEVSGRVSRHVETEGTVAAVSVAFDVLPEQKSQLAALVRAAEETHQRRAATGISGRIEELGMPNLIQMLGRSSPLGTLSATSGTEEGVLAFEGGNLRYARLGATRGLKALGRMLVWKEGSFEFHAHVDALELEDEPMHLEVALLEATRRVDEAAHARTPRLDPTLRFRVDRGALASLEALAKIEEAVLDLAVAGFTVRRILDVVPEHDSEVASALAALIERGVLLPEA